MQTDIWYNSNPDQRSHFKRYLSLFHGVKTFQLFHDQDKTQPARIIHNADPVILHLANKNGYGIYMSINETDGKGRKADNVVKVRAVFADFDKADQGLSQLTKPLALEPHLIVESSLNKFHVYWFVDDKFPLKGFRNVQKAIAYNFKSDPAIHDLPRVLRVPGFYHKKKEPCPVRILLDSPQEPISYSQCMEMFPPEPVKQRSARRYATDKITGKYKGPYGVSAGDRNNALIRAIGIMVKEQMGSGEIEQQAFKFGNACIPPMKEREIWHCVISGRRFV